MENDNFPPVPTTWGELAGLRNYLKDCSVWFLRKKEDEEKYTADMRSINRHQMLGRIRKQMGGNNIALVKNEYPHTNILQNFPKAQHYCLWNVEGPLKDREISKIVNEKFPNEEWFWMERGNAYMSIPEIWHCHIYINKD